MDIKDIIELAKAGFTKDEIIQLTSSLSDINQAGAAAEKQDKPTEPQTALEPEKTEPEPQPEPVKEDPRIDDILNKLQVVTDTMQKNAILGTRQPERKSTDDILAQIINPTYKKE